MLDIDELSLRARARGRVAASLYMGLGGRWCMYVSSRSETALAPLLCPSFVRRLRGALLRPDWSLQSLIPAQLYQWPSYAPYAQHFFVPDLQAVLTWLIEALTCNLCNLYG